MVSEKPWRPEAVLFLGAGLMLTLLLSAMALFVAQRLAGEHQFVMFLVSTFNAQLLIGIMIHFFLRYHGLTWRDFLGITRLRLFFAVPIGFLIALLSLPEALLLLKASAEIMTVVKLIPEQQGVVQVFEGAEDNLQRVVFGFAAIVMAPVVEESLFRGILYPFLKQHGHPVIALVGTSLLFGAIHMNMMIFLPLFFFALVLIGIYELTDTLLAAVVAHSTFNAINFFMLMNQREISRWLEAIRDRI
jgi:membrane protease YdiL (CAAX protease family)